MSLDLFLEVTPDSLPTKYPILTKDAYEGVLAGLFWFMGLDSLRSSGLVQKILYFLLDHALTPPSSPLRKVRKSRILLFVGLQLLGFGIAFGITQTTAAIGFPVVILLLVPLRSVIVPKLPFTAQELAILDGPTASPFVSYSCLESSTNNCVVGRLWSRLEGQYRSRRVK